MSSSAEKLIPNSGKGADFEKYSWTQRLGEVTITIPVPAGTRGKQVNCKITDKGLVVKRLGETLLEGEFHKPVKSDDSFWTIQDQKAIAIELQKRNGMEWWSCAIKGEPEIDTQKVEPEDTELSSLDGESRQMVEKMMFDQRQKAAGLPTSDDMQAERILENFKAQHPEMDFSQAKINK